MKAVKVGDIGTEHDGFHPTKVTAGSGDVFIDGQPAARIGDPLEPHDKPKHPKHGRTIATGSSTVFINGKPAALTGGKIDCGGVTIGSGTVNIGDQPPPSMDSDVKSSTTQASTYDEQLKILDENNKPVEGYPYYVKTVEGNIYKGRTDKDGMTCRMPTKQPEYIKVLCGDEALAEGGDF